VLVFFGLLALAGCGVFEVGIETRSSTATATVAGVDAPTATPTAAPTETRHAPKMMTPTPTPMPDDTLRVAFAREGDVWLWAAGQEPTPLTQSGDVGENRIKLSDDGTLVAFRRGVELWVIRTDGTGERRLIGQADLDAMEPADPGVWLYRCEWVPGTHTLACNTVLRTAFLVDPTDDLHLIDADTGEHRRLLPPGQGGHFYHSPDGSQIAVVRSGTIDLIDADGGTRRQGVLTYTPSKPFREVRYYAEAVWAADGSALGVTVLPPDPDAQPDQYTSLWRVSAEGTPARLVANVPTGSNRRIAFSPDLAYAAYLQQTEADSKADLADLMIVELHSGKTTLYATHVWRFGGWAPGSQQFAFLTMAQPGVEEIQMHVGWPGKEPVPVESRSGVLYVDVRWIDESRYIVLGKDLDVGDWVLALGDARGSEAILSSIPELPGSDVPSYDFVSRQTSTAATASPTPRPSPTPDPGRTPLPRPSALHVAYIVDADLVLWKDVPPLSTDAKPETIQLTRDGGVIDVRISGDGAVLAFVRDGELWAVDADGSDERRLVSATDLSEMEPIQQTEFPIALNRFEWVPGSHLLAFNTRLELPIGLLLNDDLHTVDVESLEISLLLAPGQGGQFTYSPDGRQVAVSNSGGISLYDADGQNRRDVLPHTPVVTYSEVRFYARPVWGDDSSSLRVAIPPADPLAQPPQLTSIWHLPTDGTPATLIGSIAALPGSLPAFSPEPRFVAYIEPAADGAPGGAAGTLLVHDLETGETIGEYPQASQIYGWALDSGHLAFLAQLERPQAQIAPFGGPAAPAHDDTSVAVIDASWVDASRYLYLASTSNGWSLHLGEIGGSPIVLATVAGRSLPYDWTY
jgi:Tol biopolymer transport system component